MPTVTLPIGFRATYDLEPGTRFSYSNIGYAILGAALSRAAGEPYVEYVPKPCSLARSCIFPEIKPSAAIIACWSSWLRLRVNKMPVPKDEIPKSTGKVIKSDGCAAEELEQCRCERGKRVPKKPVASVKAEPKKGMDLVKGTAKGSGKRKSA